MYLRVHLHVAPVSGPESEVPDHSEAALRVKRDSVVCCAHLLKESVALGRLYNSPVLSSVLQEIRGLT